MTSPRDQGSVTILMMAVCAIGLTMTFRLIDVGTEVVDRARARDIADATALAGVHGSSAQSQHIARANDAVLVEFDEDRDPTTGGTTVYVAVEFAGWTMSAWASDDG